MAFVWRLRLPGLSHFATIIRSTVGKIPPPLAATVVAESRWPKPASDWVKPSRWSPMESRQLKKARDKARVKRAETFGACAEKWLRGYQMADFTRDMRRSIYERELKPKVSN